MPPTTSAIILQARMGSSRMPGKVMREILGKPLLAYQVERLQKVPRADRLIVATSTNTADDVIAAWCAAQGVECFRGSEHDVLDRYYQAARHCGCDVVVRATADCPLNDPAVVGEVLRYLLDHQDGCDFVSNSLERTFPYGIAAAAFKFGCLEDAWREAVNADEREHVTAFIYWRPERYRLACVRSGGNYTDQRWTVDTPEDFELVRRVIETLYPAHPDFSWRDVLDLLTRHPEWRSINAAIVQKSISKPALHPDGSSC